MCVLTPGQLPLLGSPGRYSYTTRVYELAGSRLVLMLPTADRGPGACFVLKPAQKLIDQKPPTGQHQGLHFISY
jgi:hypothetical protein